MDKNKEEWVGSEDWNKLCGLIGFHPLDGRLALICKIIESEKKKSYEEGYEEALEVVNENPGHWDTTDEVLNELDKLERGKQWKD